MFSPDDTIVAIATPAGRGGIGVVRVSGPGALRVADGISERTAPLEPRRATLVRITRNRRLSIAPSSRFSPPLTPTPGKTCSRSAHTGARRSCTRSWKRQSSRGRGSPSRVSSHFAPTCGVGSISVQAEAVKDLVDAVTPLQARAAFDQLEGTLTTRIREIDTALFEVSARLEASLDLPTRAITSSIQGAAAEIDSDRPSIDALLSDAGRGRLVREGAQVVIARAAERGKSSIFNRLAGAGRAIVTDIPGTTRDLSPSSRLEGMAVTLVDTAGLRAAAADAVEHEGIARAHAAGRIADLVDRRAGCVESAGGDDDDLLATAVAAARHGRATSPT